MKNIELSNLSQIIVDSIFDNELDHHLRKKILDDIPEEHYDIACQVFHETRTAYFQLGLTLLSNLK